MSAPAQPCILVIEDDGAIRSTLIDMLEFNGYTVIHAENGTDGIALARNRRPDLILTDLRMPGLDGFQVIQALQADESTRSIPIVIVTASAEPEKMRPGLTMGARQFIVKPFTEDQILEALRTHLKKAPP